MEKMSTLSSHIKLLAFDIDGVLTDGKKYIGAGQDELKAVQLRDLDALGMLKNKGYLLGCISGEDTLFCRKLAEIEALDFAVLGCKDKAKALEDIRQKQGLKYEEVCYVGDGRYDIPVLKKVGLAICPADAIPEAKHISDIVLQCRGGEGCLAEIYTILTCNKKDSGEKKSAIGFTLPPSESVLNGIIQHRDVVDRLERDEVLLNEFSYAVSRIIESLETGGSLFLCGNGGSAADAQHLAAELVGRFYLERKAFKAQALTVNTSVLTCLANDYDYDMIFARQLEGAASPGDCLIGFTTSGKSPNVLKAFRTAKKMGLHTILMTGEISDDFEILSYADCAVRVPSQCTPRIQEMHILLGHILCELVEYALAGE